MKKIYDAIFSLKIFKNLMKISIFEKLLSYEMITYLFFGVMTTVVNFAVFFVADKILGGKALFSFSLFSNAFNVTLEDVSTLIAWLFAVIFAYVTNKFLVFQSKDRSFKVVCRELLSFFGARILSFIVFESLGFMLLRNILINIGAFSNENVSMWIAKIVMAVAVVIFNYIVSKLVIFKKGKKV